MRESFKRVYYKTTESKIATKNETLEYNYSRKQKKNKQKKLMKKWIIYRVIKFLVIYTLVGTGQFSVKHL